MVNPDDVSPMRRREVVDALRRGTVPNTGLDLFAVGLDRFSATIDTELDTVAQGGAQFKALRGEYGSGKTFFARWIVERAKRRGMAASEIQISENETPLHRLETVYRRLTEQMSTSAHPPSALRHVLEGWFFTLEEEVLDERDLDDAALAEAVDALAEQRLAVVAARSASFSAALRAYRRARLAGDDPLAEGVLAWIGGQPSVAASVKRAAAVKGDLDHYGATDFLQGLLTVLRDSGHPGMVLVLDEIETLQRVRSDVREKGLNALRQFIDEIAAGRYPGLYLVITGTPPFFDGTQGVQRLAPLAQRLETEFDDPRWDNLRAPQLRLTGFDHAKLTELGGNIRDLYAAGAPERVALRVDDAYIADFAGAVAGRLGGRVGMAPRLFLKKLIDVLDKVDQYEDFDPRENYTLAIGPAELTDTERNASADSIEIDL